MAKIVSENKKLYTCSGTLTLEQLKTLLSLYHVPSEFFRGAKTVGTVRAGIQRYIDHHLLSCAAQVVCGSPCVRYSRLYKGVLTFEASCDKDRPTTYTWDSLSCDFTLSTYSEGHKINVSSSMADIVQGG